MLEISQRNIKHEKGFSMTKALIHLSWIALLMTGCMSVRSNSVAIGPGGITSDLDASALPTIHLQFAGATLQGLQSAFFWEAPDGRSSFGAQNLVPNPPNYPSTLVAQVGQTVDIVVTSANFPPAIVITELDTQGIPISSSVLQPSASRTPYSLITHGQYILQVTAQWSSQNFVTFLFKVDIEP
jgi:hypothetical protein